MSINFCINKVMVNDLIKAANFMKAVLMYYINYPKRVQFTYFGQSEF